MIANGLFFSGNLELSEKCFQELILKDQNHPAALINYAALLLCRYGSVVAGMLLMKLTSFMNSFHLLFLQYLLCKFLRWWILVNFCRMLLYHFKFVIMSG